MLLLHPLDFSLRSRIGHHALSKAPELYTYILYTYISYIPTYEVLQIFFIAKYFVGLTERYWFVHLNFPETGKNVYRI
jgi:hypothetical protein